MLGASRHLKQFTTTPLPPTPGAIVLTANTTSSTSIDLSWTYTQGTGMPTTPTFRIRKSTDNGVTYSTVASQTSKTYTDNTVTSGNTYYYLIDFTYTPTGGSSTLVESNTVNVTVTATASVPGTPINFTATSITDKQYLTSLVYNTSGVLITSSVKQTRVLLQWTKPNENGSPIIEYKIEQANIASPSNFYTLKTVPFDGSNGVFDISSVIQFSTVEGQSNESIFRITARNNEGYSTAATAQAKSWRYSGVQYLTGKSTWSTSGRYIIQMIMIAGGGGGGYHAAAGGGGAGELAIISNFDAQAAFGASPAYDVGIGGLGGTSGAGKKGGDTSFYNITVIGGGGGGGGDTLSAENNGQSGGSGGGGARFFYGTQYSTPGGSATNGTNGAWSPDRTTLTPTRYISVGSKGFDSDTNAPPASQSGGGGGGAGQTFTNTTTSRTGGSARSFTYVDGTTAYGSAGGDGGSWTYPNHGTSVAGTTQPYAGSGGGGGKSYTAGSAGKDGVIVIEYLY